MARGEPPHRSADGPANPAHPGIEPDNGGGPTRQREVLAQFEAAIAGMHTRQIQMGLRQLLAGTVPPPWTQDTAAAPSPPAREAGMLSVPRAGTGAGVSVQTGRRPAPANPGNGAAGLGGTAALPPPVA